MQNANRDSKEEGRILKKDDDKKKKNKNDDDDDDEAKDENSRDGAGGGRLIGGEFVSVGGKGSEEGELQVFARTS